jgi:hypothetical protein
MDGPGLGNAPEREGEPAAGLAAAHPSTRATRSPAAKLGVQGDAVDRGGGLECIGGNGYTSDTVMPHHPTG